VKVSARARSRDDRAGEPLDGLVNLFDVGIVLAVAFLLAALASVELTPEVLSERTQQQNSTTAPPDSVIVPEDEKAKQVQIKPGEKVIGRGEAIGTVYQLSDGRTVIVRTPQP
jgi:hypothetical protein